MKRYFPLLVLVLGVAGLACTLLPPRNHTAFDLVGFGRLPVLADGRLKPFDTVARSSLLQLQGRQRVSDPARSEPFVRTPTEWLVDVFFHPALADTFPTFRIESPELLALLGIGDDQVKVQYDSPAKRAMATVGLLPATRSRFAFDDLKGKLSDIERQAELAQPVEAQQRTPFQRAVVQLYGDIVLYQQLKHTLVYPDADDFLGELLRFQEILPAGVKAVRAKQAGQPYDHDVFSAMIALGQRYDAMASRTNLLAIPPVDEHAGAMAWRTTGQALLETFATGSVDPSVLAYAGLAHSWRANQPQDFNHIIELYRKELAKQFAPQLRQTDLEVRFNSAQPFYWSMYLYVGAFFLAIASWLKWPRELGRAAFWLVLLAFIATTAGIATRMWIEGRPPVTNLYSSALFIGWGAGLLCIILEAIYRNAIGSVAAGLIGFGTLLIAHHLALGGDTMEMMRAVLDSNFWLATHVVVVTTGYASTFLAGFLALIYVFRGMFTRTLDRATADALARMVYGIVCFATLFSFVGTVLGGIWADQSWGRFWGWDPKENGALIIVLWNAIILHARWGGLIRQRGLICLAIFGNIVTSWSWFGTNMLGIGLHSYGFTEAAFVWLTAFIASQLGIIAMANLPLTRWRSFRPTPP